MTSPAHGLTACICGMSRLAGDGSTRDGDGGQDSEQAQGSCL